MEAIGAKVECDDLACMYATVERSDPNAKRIVLGSHCDSVKNGGNYDCMLGVITGMEVLEAVAGSTHRTAMEEAARCLLCHDAPCSQGCITPGKMKWKENRPYTDLSLKRYY